MSRVTTHHVNVGDANDEGVLNTVLTNWNTQTAAVNEENLRTEAVDRVNIDFATDIHHKAQQSTFAGSAATADEISATSYANSPTTIDGSTVQLNYNLASHEATSRVVRCSFEVTSSATHGSDFIGLEARLLESTTGGGGTWSAIADTERAVKSAIVGRELRGCIFLMGTVGSSRTYVGVEFRKITTGGGSSKVNVQNIVLSIDGYN